MTHNCPICNAEIDDDTTADEPHMRICGACEECWLELPSHGDVFTLHQMTPDVMDEIIRRMGTWSGQIVVLENGNYGLVFDLGCPSESDDKESDE
jgi:hypothetical protein